MARTSRPTISAVLIVKDEEEYLARCLESVRWVDEIVVYDTGSTDRTVEVARRFTGTVVQGYWNDDFGAARNRALEHATSEWVLIVDADETFEANPRALRKHLGAGTASFFSVTVSTRVPTPGAVDAPIVSVRIFRRSDGQYAGALHEQVVARSNVRLRIRPMPGATIRHSGYSEGPEAMAARMRRNFEIAERELATAEAAPGADEAGLGLRRANLARALVGVGRMAEGLELSEQIYLDGKLAGPAVVHFAQSMALAAASTADFERARTWEARLRAVAGNPVWADVLRVQIAASEDTPELALDALECIPTTMVDDGGRHIRRVDHAAYEVWALWRLGRVAAARRVAEDAARAGVLAGRPAELWTWLGEEGVRRAVDVLPDDAWQLLAVLCVQDGATPAGRQVLTIMADARPGDPAVLLCARKLAFSPDLPGLEEAAGWAARMRAAGLEDCCPLATIATSADAPATQRARAAALALFAYDDARALPALEAALAQVAPEDEAGLAAQLDVLAPGLVQRA